jgi:hypothetical protein
MAHTEAYMHAKDRVFEEMAKRLRRSLSLTGSLKSRWGQLPTPTATELADTDLGPSTTDRDMSSLSRTATDPITFHPPGNNVARIRELLTNERVKVRDYARDASIVMPMRSAEQSAAGGHRA